MRSEGTRRCAFQLVTAQRAHSAQQSRARVELTNVKPAARDYGPIETRKNKIVSRPFTIQNLLAQMLLYSALFLPKLAS